MIVLPQAGRQSLRIFVTAVAMLLASCANMGAGNNIQVTLNGNQEVPPVATPGTGSGNITVNSDRTISGSITTTGVAGTAAHIHEAPAGKNGPIIIPLTKTSDSSWAVPGGAKLTDAQYDSYKAGNLYINVHSATNKGGEIRGQLRP